MHPIAGALATDRAGSRQLPVQFRPLPTPEEGVGLLTVAILADAQNFERVPYASEVLLTADAFLYHFKALRVELDDTTASDADHMVMM